MFASHNLNLFLIRAFIIIFIVVLALAVVPSVA
jgi:hypothetical protein